MHISFPLSFAVAALLCNKGIRYDDDRLWTGDASGAILVWVLDSDEWVKDSTAKVCAQCLKYFGVLGTFFDSLLFQLICFVPFILRPSHLY